MSRRARKRTRLAAALALVICCVGCDQAAKRIATETLRGTPPQSYLGDTVRLQYAVNPGGFLSLGAGLNPHVRMAAFLVLNAAFLAGIAWLLVARWSMHPGRFIAVVLLLAGGLGNLIDRVLEGGHVIDFINLGLGPVRTGIFNVADVALMAGALLLVLCAYRGEDSAGSARAGGECS
jgi:signal peptidase II